MKAKDKLGLVSLTAMCVGSMIGAGLFALPQNVASTTGPAALLIAWGITFVGMICLASVFQTLSNLRPDLDAGVYAYAKDGLGDYLGFCSAWGYWISAWVGNVGFVMMLCSAMSFFFPVFGAGTNLYSILLSSALIWGIAFLCIKGIKSATLVNNVTTFAKIVPILVFIVIAGYFFKKEEFFAGIAKTKDLGSVTDQVSGMMLVTVWTFIGIEGASVFSAKAKNRSDVGKATIIGFFIVFMVLFLVSALPYGILPQEDIASLGNPSTGTLLKKIIGAGGEAMMNIGLIVSIVGALLAWILMAAEVPFIACKKDKLFPKFFGLENSFSAPYGALIITAISQQVYIIMTAVYDSGYLVTIKLSTSMILVPYFFSAIFAVMMVLRNKKYIYGEYKKKRIFHLLVSCIATVYGAWLIYAAGIKYLILATTLYLVGNVVFALNKIHRKERVLKSYELIPFVLCTLVGVMCVLGIGMGWISLSN